MKKTLALLFMFVLAVCLLTSCFPKACEHVDADSDGVCDKCDEVIGEVPGGLTTPMTYEEYMAADDDAEVLVEAYVQATQAWWNNEIMVYLADADGAYFAYKMVCSETDAARLVPGTKIRISGYKTTYNGEVEIAEGCTFTFVEGADTYIADAIDLTDKFGDDAALLPYQNQLVSFTAVEITEISYKDGTPGDDIYVSFKQGTKTGSFCVERYLTAPTTDLYKMFTENKVVVGDVVDIEGFLYWYNGANTHITSIAKAMTYAEYMAAEDDDKVIVEAYVQARQAWWNNEITVYLADRDGAYFAYKMVCSETDAARLVPGTKIRISGYKTTYNGEVEIAEGCTFTFVEGADTYTANPIILTSMFGDNDALLPYQNQLVHFEALEITEISYKNGTPGDDIYVTFKKGDLTCQFCVEVYLTGASSALYTAFTSNIFEVGDVVNVTGFLYWYNGANVHITGMTPTVQ